MKRQLKLEIASPCTESWDDMEGDERTRHCARCQLNVYNIHEFSMDEVEALRASSNGRMCVRLYQRADGTVLTSDCPVGLRKVRMRLAASLATAAAFTGAVIATALQLGAGEGHSGFSERFLLLKLEVRKWPVVGAMVKQIDPPARREMMRMGGLPNHHADY